MTDIIRFEVGKLPLTGSPGGAYGNEYPTDPNYSVVWTGACQNGSNVNGTGDTTLTQQGFICQVANTAINATLKATAKVYYNGALIKTFTDVTAVKDNVVRSNNPNSSLCNLGFDDGFPIDQPIDELQNSR